MYRSGERTSGRAHGCERDRTGGVGRVWGWVGGGSGCWEGCTRTPTYNPRCCRLFPASGLPTSSVAILSAALLRIYETSCLCKFAHVPSTRKFLIQFGFAYTPHTWLRLVHCLYLRGARVLRCFASLNNYLHRWGMRLRSTRPKFFRQSRNCFITLHHLRARVSYGLRRFQQEMNVSLFLLLFVSL